jgi:hypothetical protein
MGTATTLQYPQLQILQPEPDPISEEQGNLRKTKSQKLQHKTGDIRRN